ncbi:hypothetical protein WOLCODRAFT_157397 [Wolfiporia cocos MD-104 SS10]|uniref:Uncharacterized protein n=1 Tax=Wolfiporia cocos (strain MD-104) TaxID=742152 RepID=A0A2H3JD91_WOLCO|nr:hypothetical protein WOLCODRAFT_157397 [Wolfiporia cocos MD-104 SS10]
MDATRQTWRPRERHASCTLAARERLRRELPLLLDVKTVVPEGQRTQLDARLEGQVHTQARRQSPEMPLWQAESAHDVEIRSYGAFEREGTLVHVRQHLLTSTEERKYELKQITAICTR